MYINPLKHNDYYMNLGADLLFPVDFWKVIRIEARRMRWMGYVA
jgi:hypothetical protein